jgi:tetratricopeptide (TPR) repeat protein
VKKLWCRALVVYFAVISLLVLNLSGVSAAEIDAVDIDKGDRAGLVIAKDEPKFLGIPLACYVSSAKLETDIQAQAFALLEVAGRYTKAGQKDKAVKVLDSSSTYLKDWKDDSANAFARVKLAAEYEEAGKGEQAKSALEPAIPQIKAIKNDTDRTFALTKVAAQYIKLGALDKANPLLEQAVAASNLIKEPYAQARATLAIATEYANAQNLEKAASLLEQSLQSIQALDNPAAKARAKTYATTNQVEKVNFALADAAAASEVAGSGLSGVSLSSFNSRGLAYVVNEYVNAGFYPPALDLAKRITDPYEQAIAFTQIAVKYAESSQSPKAVSALGQALNAAKSVRDPLGKASSLAEVADAYAKLGKNRNAIDALNRSLQATDGANNGDDKVLLLIDIANQYVEVGDRNAANSTLAKIQDILIDPQSQLSNKAGQLANVALLYAAIGQNKQAMQIAKALDRQFGRPQLVNLLECAESVQ